MLEKEEVQNEELDKVAGGISESTRDAIKDYFKRSITYENVTCRKCGKEYQHAVFHGVLGMAMTDEYFYYQGLCSDCAEKYPYRSPRKPVKVQKESKQ